MYWMGHTALELVWQSGLGYSFNPLVGGTKPHPFSEAVKAFSPTVSRTFIEQEYLLPTLMKISTPKFRRWVLDRFPFKRSHLVHDIVDTWDRTTTDIFEETRTALREGDEGPAKQVGQAKDLMGILIIEAMEFQGKFSHADWAIGKTGGISGIKAIISKNFGYGSTTVRGPLKAVDAERHHKNKHYKAMEEMISVKKALLWMDWMN
ncbi:hypothetical protein DXG01_016467 [Tephrocybe rancida]|nr:hypothetical protein DXG01_016467 [Tephrocybe rancida]